MAPSKLEKSRRVQIQISAELNRRLDRAARESGVSKSAYVRVALEREFAQDKELENKLPRRQSPVPVS